MAADKAEPGKPFPREEELRSQSAGPAVQDAKRSLDKPTVQKEQKKAGRNDERAFFAIFDLKLWECDILF